MHDMAKSPVAASLWAAEELITGVEKALDELRGHGAPEGGAIMSDVANTEANSDEQDDSFSPLMVRLESAIHRLKLAADDLQDLAEKMPAEEHGSAAFVVAETTEDLNQLYRSFEAWEATHKYTPRDMQPLMEHLRQTDTDADTVDRMLHGRTVLSPSVSPSF
jgi:DNA repair ATPase RecN